MADGSINDEAGLFGPDSMIWRVNREAVVALAGTCAILMQLAHPKVAAGVREHSQFERDLAGRLQRTLRLTLAWVFGSRAEAIQAVRVVNRLHDAVTGPGYSARDPQLLMWVQATLVYAAIRAYRTLVGPLTEAEADQYYQDTKEIGVLLGIPPATYPSRLSDFDEYLQSMIDRGEVTVDDDARRMAGILLHPRIPGIPELAFAPVRSLTAGLLPPRLRDQYAMRWGRRDRMVFAFFGSVLPRLLHLTPASIRYLPPARHAYRRLRLQPA